MNCTLNPCERNPQATGGFFSLHWRHNELDGVLNRRCLEYIPNHLFMRRSKKTSKLRIIGLCEGNSQMTSEFPAQRAGKAENVSIWWRHDVTKASNKETVSMLCRHEGHCSCRLLCSRLLSTYVCLVTTLRLRIWLLHQSPYLMH